MDRSGWGFLRRLADLVPLTPDVSLILGLFFLCLYIPSRLAALAERRTPWTAWIIGVSGAILVGSAVVRQSYTLAEIPDIFYRVIAPLVPF
ncbi:hypothetical protein [Chachezhania antarctica]|uniref:hypothetical protein n=1 Tax=Chachezhania antarctica TaxID=2340860 RepID=UPI000EAECAC8|nr:hypothetical protein [Chachezhania antarctica]|tara:strand:+ start:813 stop:1085 length:273 start_codon:yes stop_codon:yes gene_type:complete